MTINFVRHFLIAMICLLLIYPSHGYQAPAHHAFPGFTQPDPIDFNDHAGMDANFRWKDDAGLGWVPRSMARGRWLPGCRIEPRASFGYDEHYLAWWPAGKLRVEIGDEARGCRRQRRNPIPQPQRSALSKPVGEVSQVEHEGISGRFRLRQQVHRPALRTKHQLAALSPGEAKWWRPIKGRSRACWRR